ncbi:MAG TPA: histidine phosphatase family protein, partial [Candidatus Saccharimonadales bacterium]|nr:histidine phosphatase family protein [Candidatus Saccharimonadales bacterium]
MTIVRPYPRAKKDKEMSETLQHLILVRHGESEGDVRRAAFKRGEPYQSTKTPQDEEITAHGIAECHSTGLWIKKHIIQAYGLRGFDGCYVSSAIRTEQSAVALELPIAVWQEDHDLDERNRGLVAGLRAEQHKDSFPKSFAQMRRDPLHWTPPNGEAIMPGVTGRVRHFMDDIG